MAASVTRIRTPPARTPCSSAEAFLDTIGPAPLRQTISPGDARTNQPHRPRSLPHPLTSGYAYPPDTTATPTTLADLGVIGRVVGGVR